ncbi:D-alanyl-D-alanine carboxypeptidase family protein [Aquibacillus kalidii]|uniref:D-alanyl-D-alanine carboxypeptidase family protein n=1 Tax=Aquibacillus kalidii TaxID=2762597 RepID=UPI0016488A7F|nr:D-alanyl-D-alanine carboxypeptidase family protein [Aquibacillus kalidii]
MKKGITFLLFFVIVSNCLPFEIKADSATTPESLLTESVVLMDAQSGQVLYEKKSTDELYPASLTKIATAIYAIEKGNLDDIVTVSENAREVEGTRVYLEQGEQVTLKKLIQGLLINSGNDAGVAIAEHLDGNITTFARRLNNYLQEEVGVEQTHFKNPHGLFDMEHVTTAFDLAKITQYAMKDEVFRDIIGTAELEWVGESWTTTLYHHHKMIREIPYDGISGGKTGYVDESGHTLMTTAEKDGLSLIVISLNGKLPMDTYKDTKQLLDYGFSHFETSSIEGGTKFTDENGQKYVVSKTLPYSHPRGEKANFEVDEDGLLTVKTTDPLVTVGYPLEKVESKTEKVETVSIQNVDNTNESSKSSILMLVSLLIALTLVVMALIRLRRKE